MRHLTLALLIPLAACGNGSTTDNGDPGQAPAGTGGTRTYAVTDFSDIEQRGPDNVDVRVGAGFSVRAEGDPNVLDKLKIERVGDALRVSRIKSSISLGSSGTANVYVTMPRIGKAGLAGSGDMAVDRVQGTSFDGNVAGSGTLTLGTVAVDEMDVAIAGSGNVAARGSAGVLNISIAGSGDVNGEGLQASEAKIKIAGSGDVRAAVDGAADVTILGSGSVDLGSKARCKVTRVGSGDVRCGG